MTEPQRLALEEEARDLSIHVRMCAMRHQQIMDAVNGLKAATDKSVTDRRDAGAALRSRIERAAWLLLIVAAGANVLPFLPTMAAMAGR